MFLDAFERVSHARGQHPAVLEAGVPTSYRQLRDHARRIGGSLRRLGIGRGDVVGVDASRSADFVAALLGAWYAGAAYLPLAASLGRERIAHVAARAPVRALVVRGSDGFDVDVPRVSVREAAPPEDESSDHPDDLAYLILTSGSTGRPKAVQVAHRGIVPFLRAQIEGFGFGPDDRGLWTLSPLFDASLSDIGVPLLAGGTLCIEPGTEDAARLYAALAARAITHVDLPPALLPVLDPDRLPDSLRTVVIGGEVCPPATVRRWARRVEVINVYGPTEATVCTSFCRCGTDWDRPWIGPPIPGIGYHVRDAAGAPVESGDGELWITGAAVADGYLGEPELTRRKFVHLADGARAYRTGDRVRIEGDRLVFAGRLDRQFKLHGRLIEPAEIEAALLRHDGVRRAAVCRREVGGRPALVAFVEGPERPAELHLEGTLPDALLPRVVVTGPLPITASNKIDHEALATAPIPRAAAATRAPLDDDRARTLAAIWARVLRRAAVGPDDDFFALGGDSLALLEVAVAAEAAALAVPPEVLRTHRTIRGVVARLDDGVPAGDAAGGTAGDPSDCGWLREDVRLPPLAWPARPRPAAVEHALITGATGFLGSRLLVELLERSDARITALVRAPDADAARARLRAVLPRPIDEDRVGVVCGDVAAPDLGLDAAGWRRLADVADAVYHLAARVDLVGDYAALRPVQVGGTRQVLRLLAAGRPKELHFASTLSVLLAAGGVSGTCREDDDLATTTRVYGGYAQSKWAAEVLVRHHAEALGDPAIYRLGLLCGDTRTGAGAPRDELRRFVRGLLRVGCIPAALPELHVDVTPIDYAAAALAALALAEGRGTFHVANPVPLPLTDLIAGLRRAGVRLERVPAGEFVERASRGGPAAAGACLGLCRALSPAAYDRHRAFDLFLATGARIDTTCTERALEGTGLRCPPPDPDLVDRYLAWALRT